MEDCGVQPLAIYCGLVPGCFRLSYEKRVAGLLG